MASKVEGRSDLLGGIAGRYPYDGVAANVVWPVSDDLQKLHSQIEHDQDDDLLIYEAGGYIPAAVEHIERRGGVALVYQKRRLLLDRLPSEEEIDIQRFPLVQIDQVQYLDEDDATQTLSTDYYRINNKAGCSSVYFADTASIAIADGPGVVWVDTVNGFGESREDVPAAWRHIVEVLADKFYDRRQIAAGGGLDQSFEDIIKRFIISAGGRYRYV